MAETNTIRSLCVIKTGPYEQTDPEEYQYRSLYDADAYTSNMCGVSSQETNTNQYEI